MNQSINLFFKNFSSVLKASSYTLVLSVFFWQAIAQGVESAKNM